MAFDAFIEFVRLFLLGGEFAMLSERTRNTWRVDFVDCKK